MHLIQCVLFISIFYSYIDGEQNNKKVYEKCKTYVRRNVVTLGLNNRLYLTQDLQIKLLRNAQENLSPFVV